ncbi:MAG: hypothetical protein RLZZ385_2267 [Pseudomonadota bacterium]|jgi:uroporphyrinogen-III synthase
MTAAADRKSTIDSVLGGKLVALPESRQLDVLAELFERRGARVLRVPLVAILDAPDQQPVRAWLRGFMANPPDYLIILTGEGLRRLSAAADRDGCLDDFVKTLAGVSKICRGPKPGRALKELGLQPDLLGQAPTTAGIIATLDELPIEGRSIAVQLYGEDPNILLMDYLRKRGALALPVSPYVYAPDSAADQVAELITALVQRRVDIIAFTSQPQVHRLLEVARARACEPALFEGLGHTLVAAVGPVVADLLTSLGIQVAVCPQDAFFMKPMVTEIERKLQQSHTM